MTPKDWRAKSGFTLVEMLAVIAIIVVLLTLLASPIASIVRGPLLTQAADEVVGSFSLAQQTAAARNQSVAVRFYQYADPSAGDSVNNQSTWKFYAMQLFLVSDNGAATPFRAALPWPAGIIADSGSTLSTLLGSTRQKTNWSNSPSDPQVSIPRAGKSYACYEFRYRPDGSTNLPFVPPAAGASNAWFITLHSRLVGDSLRSPPSDYVTIQVDPINGSTTVYRP